jgi:hypothetical protein
MAGIATVHTNRIIVALQVAVASAVTFFAMYATQYFFGRVAFWVLGLTLLGLAGLAFFRLRK